MPRLQRISRRLAFWCYVTTAYFHWPFSVKNLTDKWTFTSKVRRNKTREIIKRQRAHCWIARHHFDRQTSSNTNMSHSLMKSVLLTVYMRMRYRLYSFFSLDTLCRRIPAANSASTDISRSSRVFYACEIGQRTCSTSANDLTQSHRVTVMKINRRLLRMNLNSIGLYTEEFDRVNAPNDPAHISIIQSHDFIYWTQYSFANDVIYRRATTAQ